MALRAFPRSRCGAARRLRRRPAALLAAAAPRGPRSANAARPPCGPLRGAHLTARLQGGAAPRRSAVARSRATRAALRAFSGVLRTLAPLSALLPQPLPRRLWRRCCGPVGPRGCARPCPSGSPPCGLLRALAGPCAARRFGAGRRPRPASLRLRRLGSSGRAVLLGPPAARRCGLRSSALACSAVGPCALPAAAPRGALLSARRSRRGVSRAPRARSRQGRACALRSSRGGATAAVPPAFGSRRAAAWGSFWGDVSRACTSALTTASGGESGDVRAARGAPLFS